MIPLSFSRESEEESITTDSLMVMETDFRMIWQSVMTVTTRKKERMIPWRSNHKC